MRLCAPTALAAVLLLAVAAVACRGGGVAGFPGYALPDDVHAAGRVSGGEVSVEGDGGRVTKKVYFVATDADLAPARDGVRARLIEHGWTLMDEPPSEIGSAWYEATSPSGDLCLTYLMIERDAISQAVGDPILAHYSVADWLRMMGEFRQLVVVFSGACDP